MFLEDLLWGPKLLRFELEGGGLRLLGGPPLLMGQPQTTSDQTPMETINLASTETRTTTFDTRLNQPVV